MPYYNAWVASDNRTLPGEKASDRDHALAIFGKELGVRLTLVDQSTAAPYLLGESE
jgi:hypothetical protein